MEPNRLKAYLKRYNSWNCPPNLYLAWRILFDNAVYPDRDRILKDALLELRDMENARSQSNFEKGRYKAKDILKLKKYNW